MSSKVKSIYNTLTDELERTFLDISKTPDIGEVGKAGLRFVDYKGLYSDRRDPGKVLVETDGSGNIEYLYRLRFRTDENESEKVYWYNSSFGWSDEQVLVAEKDNLMAVVEYASRNSEVVDDNDEERLSQLFEELRSEIKNKRFSLTIDDVVEFVKNKNIDKLQNIVSPDERAAVEFWKLLYSYGEDEIIENPLCVEFSDDYTAIFRSKRVYKSSDTEREYPFFLIVCVDEIPDRFIVKRVRRSEKTSSVHNWSKKKVKDVLGYDLDYRCTDSVRPNDRVKIQGDLRALSYDYGVMKNKYSDYIEKELQNRISSLYARMYVDRMNLELKKNVRFGKGIRIDRGASTNEIKEIQDGLDISENEVRKEQQSRGIGRLSSNLRREIVESVFDKNTTEWMYDRTRPEIEKFQKEDGTFGRRRISRVSKHRSGSAKRLKDIMINHTDDITRATIRDIVDSSVEHAFEDDSELSVRIGDADITFLSGSEHPRVSYVSKDFKIKKRVIVPEDTTVHISHGARHMCSIDFKKGVYDFKKLKGMSLPSF